MAYWLVKKETVGTTNRCLFFADKATDVNSLPTENDEGTDQHDDISHLKCGRGSVVLNIEDSEISILDSSGTWQAQTNVVLSL